MQEFGPLPMIVGNASPTEAAPAEADSHGASTSYSNAPGFSAAKPSTIAAHVVATVRRIKRLLGRRLDHGARRARPGPT